MIAQARLCLRFYLGLGAPCVLASYPDCRVRAAAGYSPDLIRALLALRRGKSEAGEVREVNFRCRIITPAGSEKRFLFKDFPRSHALHDLERILRCSRVDRAWRAAHLLPRLGILTPAPVGTAFVIDNGQPMEYLATEWLPEAMPFHMRLRELNVRSEDPASAASPSVILSGPNGTRKGYRSNAPGERARMLVEFAGHMRRWHDSGIYLRDLVTNVLTRESPEDLEYWLTDLDQLHPIKRVTRTRLLRQMAQLARWTGPLTESEAETIAMTYLSRISERAIARVVKVLIGTPPAESASSR